DLARAAGHGETARRHHHGAWPRLVGRAEERVRRQPSRADRIRAELGDISAGTGRKSATGRKAAWSKTASGPSARTVTPGSGCRARRPGGDARAAGARTRREG